MASLDDIVDATKILAEDSDNPIDGSGSKSGEIRVIGSGEQKDDDGSAASTVVTERVVETGTVLESTYKSKCGLGVMDNEKIGAGDLSYAGDGGTNVSGNAVDGVIGREGKINDCDVSRVDDVGSESKNLKENERNVSDANVDGDGKGRWNGEKLEDGDHGFRVGDFVWGKIKSHPWWPGQVYDPRDASEFAVKHSQEGRILVAFFGDGSCSWCLPSQLMPFVENFTQMSMDSSSKSFFNAIERAADEIGRLVESNMTCKCIPLDKRGHLARPMVANAGVRAGVLAPDLEINRISIPEYEPADIFSKVMNFAKAVSVDSLFELAVLRSWLSAFYYTKCGYQLPVYSEPLYIEGLEDYNDDNETAVTNYFSVPIELPIQGPQEEDWVSPPGVNSLRSQTSADYKIYHRKQKSVAELMGKNNTDKPQSQKRATLKEGKANENFPSSKREKIFDGEIEEGVIQGGSSTGKLGRKRRLKVSELDNIKNDVVVNAENSGIGVVQVVNGSTLVGKPKEIVVAATEKLYSPRERKKSKYLSPPYTNLSWRILNSTFNPESESEKNMTKASADLSASPSFSELDDRASDEKLQSKKDGLDANVKPNGPALDNDKKLTFSVSAVNISVDELLSEIQFAVLDPFYLSNKGSLDMVWAFISAFRSSTYLHGSDYKAYQKCDRVHRKKISLPSRKGNPEKENAESPDLFSPKVVRTERKPETSRSKKAAEFARKRSSLEKSEGNASSSLLLTFAPGFPLPSKEEIVRLFSKFGSLNEKETKVVTDSRSVQIVFVKDSDAEAAFKSSISRSPFGIENVNCWLQRSPTGSKPEGPHPIISSPKRAAEEPGFSQPKDDFMSDVRAIRQKLDIMTAILENYYSKFSTEDRSILKDEMKHLMENVETVSEKVRVVAHLKRS